MKTFKTVDQLIKEQVDIHVSECITRKNGGFKVLEVDVTMELSTRLFLRLNDELTIGGRLQGWKFDVFTQGEFEGKMGMTYLRDSGDVNVVFVGVSN